LDIHVGTPGFRQSDFDAIFLVMGKSQKPIKNQHYQQPLLLL